MQFLESLIDAADLDVRVLEPAVVNNTVIDRLGVSDNSTLGQIVKYTAGVLVDSAWLRLFGGQGSEYTGSIEDFNDFQNPEKSRFPGVLTIGYDAMGGVFGINTSMLVAKPGTIVYFAPDSLEWESLDIGHTDFVSWAFSKQLKKFYGDYQWHKFEEDSLRLRRDEAYNFYPPLWTKEGKNMAASNRRTIPLAELWQLFESYKDFLTKG